MGTRVKRGGRAAESRPGTQMAEAELAAFYQRVFLPLVRRATWRHGLEKEDAKDVVQEAFVLAIARMDPTGNPRAWLIQVVDHLALNWQRKQARRAQLVERWLGPTEPQSRAKQSWRGGPEGTAGGQVEPE